MPNNEDYLDSLLNNVTRKLSEFDEDFEQKKQTADPYMTKKNLPPKTMKALEIVRENQFLREFEEELKQEDADQFLEAFEAELDDDMQEFERTKNAQAADDDDYMDQIEQLVSESQEKPPVDDVDLMSDLQLPVDDFRSFQTDDGSPASDLSGPSDSSAELQSPDEEPVLGMDAPPEGMEALGSLFEDEKFGPAGEDLLGGMTMNEGEDPLLSAGMSFGDGETILPEDGALDDAGIEELLNSLSEDEALSDIGKMLEADEQSISLEDLSAEPESLAHAADLVESSQAEKNPKKEKKKGFFAKFMDLLFGEDEDDEDLAPQTVEGEDDLDNISDENLEILRAMSGDMMGESDGKPDKKKKKKEKKKKEKKKKEPKEKKKKEPKPEKPKKEKKPKEKGPREKPLPRGPVIMIWLLAVSIFAFVFLGNKMLMKANALRTAEQCFDRGDYVSSYEELSSVKIGESETALYERAKALAGVQTELNAYYSMMEVRNFDLALDCLVRALGRSDLHMAEAEEWGVTVQMNALVSETVKQLQDQFNVTEAQARELYDIDERDDYSLALDEILKSLGLK